LGARRCDRAPDTQWPRDLRPTLSAKAIGCRRDRPSRLPPTLRASEWSLEAGVHGTSQVGATGHRPFNVATRDMSLAWTSPLPVNRRGRPARDMAQAATTRAAHTRAALLSDPKLTPYVALGYGFMTCARSSTAKPDGTTVRFGDPLEAFGRQAGASGAVVDEFRAHHRAPEAGGTNDDLHLVHHDVPDPAGQTLRMNRRRVATGRNSIRAEALFRPRRRGPRCVQTAGPQGT
jgi:hypothetical protein